MYYKILSKCTIRENETLFLKLLFEKIVLKN